LKIFENNFECRIHKSNKKEKRKDADRIKKGLIPGTLVGQKRGVTKMLVPTFGFFAKHTSATRMTLKRMRKYVRYKPVEDTEDTEDTNDPTCISHRSELQ